MVIKDLNTNDPKDAREYLRDLYLPYSEQRVEWIKFHDTGFVAWFKEPEDIDRMGDTEAVLAAKGMENILRHYVKKYRMQVN